MALKKKITDRVFMLLFGLTGLILFGISIYCLQLLPPDCNSNLLEGGITAIMVTSSVFLASSVSYTICNWKGQCYAENSSEDYSNIYLSISAMYSGLTAVLLGIIGGELKGKCVGDQTGSTPQEKNNGKTLKFLIWFMFALCAIALFFSLGGLYYNYTTEDTGSSSPSPEPVKQQPTGWVFGRGLNAPQEQEDEDEDEFESLFQQINPPS